LRKQGTDLSGSSSKVSRPQRDNDAFLKIKGAAIGTFKQFENHEEEGELGKNIT